MWNNCDEITWKSNDDFLLYGAILKIQRSLFPPSCAKKTPLPPRMKRLPHHVLSKLQFFGPTKINVWEAQHKNASLFLWGAVQLQHLELLNRMWGHHLLDQKIAYQRITTQKANMTVECNIPGESEDLCLGFYGLTILDPYQAHPDFFRKLLMNKLPKFSYTTCDPHVGVEMWGQECNNPQTRSQLPWRQSHPSASLRTTSRTESILGST